MTEGPLQMPGSKINDPMFQVTDVADRNLTSALRLPDRFSLPIQAIYSHFNPESWEKFTKMDLLDRHRVAVIRQISVSRIPSFVRFCWSTMFAALVHPWLTCFSLSAGSRGHAPELRGSRCPPGEGDPVEGCSRGDTFLGDPPG